MMEIKPMAINTPKGRICKATHDISLAHGAMTWAHVLSPFPLPDGGVEFLQLLKGAAMKKALLMGILAIAVMGMTGCASTLETDVTQFHDPKAVYWGKTFALLADPDQASSLEFQTDAGMVSAQLQAHGMTPEAEIQVSKSDSAAPPSPAQQQGSADYLVTVSFRPIGSRVEYWAYEDPVFPGYYRWGPQPFVTVGSQVFTRVELDVSMYDGPAWRQGRKVTVFDGRASAETDAAEPNAIIRPLVEALFQTFPAPSGQTRRIDLELP